MSLVRMRVTVEVDGIGPIGGGWTLQEGFERGRKEGIAKLENAIREIKGRIIGTPEMLVVIISDKD